MSRKIETDKSGSYYIKKLFPEFNSSTEFWDSLKSSEEGERWLDLGSGFNPYRLDSLINQVKRRSKNIYLEGLDPLYSASNLYKGFHFLNTIGLPMALLSAIKGKRPTTAIPGLAEEIPMESQTYSKILSSWSFPIHFFEDERPKVWQEIHRVLKPEGEVRLFPVIERSALKDAADSGFQNLSLNGNLLIGRK